MKDDFVKIYKTSPNFKLKKSLKKAFIFYEDTS